MDVPHYQPTSHLPLAQLTTTFFILSKARPYQAFTQLLETLLFNNKHLLVTRVTVSSEHPYIHKTWYNFILHDEFK